MMDFSLLFKRMGAATTFLSAYDLELFEQIYQQLLDVSSVQAGDQIIRNCGKGYVITWETFGLTLRGLRTEATPVDLAVLRISSDDFTTLMHKMEGPQSWDFLCANYEVRDSHWHGEMHILEAYCLEEATADGRDELCPPVPRGFGKEHYVLHLFSGRRRHRHGDFQFYFDKLENAFPDYCLQVVSLDIVLSATWGDLMRPSARSFWKQAIGQRVVVGLLGVRPARPGRRRERRTPAIPNMHRKSCEPLNSLGFLRFDSEN